jgi:hypothetical protein
MGVRAFVLVSTLCVVYAAIGISSIIISKNNPNATCGIHGVPPLPIWVYGTGISYTALAGCYIVSLICMFFDVPIVILLVAAFGNGFVLIWTIMGATTLWGEGELCILLSKQIWSMGTAGVILSIITLVVTITQLFDVFNDI